VLRIFKFESLQHFIVKAALFHVLRRMKHNIVTEFQLPNGFGDLLDVTTSTHYELEFNFKKHHREKKIAQYKRPGFEIIVINCDKLPTEYHALAKALKELVVPG
jgi:hypothetical protein